MLNRGPRGSRRESSTAPALVLNRIPFGTEVRVVHQAGLLTAGPPSEKFAIRYVQAHHSGLELTRAPLGVPRKRVLTSFDPGFRFEDCLSNKASSTSNTNPSTLWGVSFLVAPLLITDAELQECRAGVGLLRRVAQPGTRNRCPARPSAGDRISRHRPDRGTRCSRRAFMRSAERSKWRSPDCRRTV